MERAAELCGVDFGREESLEEGRGGAASLRVIADHARATTFLIADGVQPSNEGRGYVLRKIIRRAIRHGRLLGATKPFFSDLILVVRDLMGGAYPELLEPAAALVPEVVLSEQVRFSRTLDVGLKKLDQLVAIVLKEIPDKILDTQSYLDRKDEEIIGPAVDLVVKWRDAGYFERRQFPGEEAFKLYDTYGLPRDFIGDA